MGDFLKREVHQLSGLVTDDRAEHPVYSEEAAVERHQGHPDWRLIHREPKLLLGLAKCLLIRHSLGQVAAVTGKLGTEERQSSRARANPPTS